MQKENLKEVKKLKDKPFGRSYGKYVIKRKGFELYQGARRILSYDDNKQANKFPFTFREYDEPYRPSIKIGSFEKTPNLKEIGYKKMLSLGFVLVGRKPRVTRYLKWRRKAKHEYFIKRRDEDLTGVEVKSVVPVGAKILWDGVNKQIYFDYGSERVGPTDLEPKKRKRPDAFLMHKLTPDERLQYALHRKLPDKNEKRKILIDEMFILGISFDTRQLVCIPEQADSIRIGAIGQPGSYKTTFLHSKQDQCYVKGYPAININDWKYETDTYPLKMTTPPYLNYLGSLNLIKRRLPMTYLSVNTKEKDNLKKVVPEIIDEDLHFYFSLSWKYFAKYYSEFTEGHRDMEFGATLSMIDWDKIQNAKSKADLYKAIEHLSKDKQTKSSYGRAKRILDFLMGLQIFDISSRTPSTIRVCNKVTKQDYDIFSPLAMMYAGLTPSIFTSSLQTVKMGKSTFLPSIINMIMKRIYEAKKFGELFQGKHLFVFIDELGTIIREGVNKPIIDTFTLGRSERIGIVYSNQSYTDLIHQVRENTDYLAMMRVGSSEERNEIAKDFGYKAKDLELEKIGVGNVGEAMIFHRRPLVLYNLDSGEITTDDDTPIKIQILPPTSLHKKPRGVE